MFAPFLDVVLIDADGVDSQGSGVVWASYAPEGLLIIACDIYAIIIDGDKCTSG